MQSFETGKMKSGALFLVLQAPVCWDDFRHLSAQWAAKLDAVVVSDPLITFDECLLEVKIGEGDFWISYDDYQSSICLEPKSIGHDEIVLGLQAKLRAGT
jgi:hypothetical protein